MRSVRNPTLFEKVILIIGLIVMVLGFIMIKQLSGVGGLNDNLLQIVFLWLILIMCIILVAVSEDVKEELRIIEQNQLEEVRLLKLETTLVKEEISLLREDMAMRAGKRPVKRKTTKRK